MGTGGVRYGAGRPAHKGKAEGCLRLDVRALDRAGCLTPGRSGGWEWRDSDSGARSWLELAAWAAELVLSYRLNGEPVEQRIPIVRTACNYGGRRPWFRCPHCSRRVAVLFLRGGGFYCRHWHCARVAYCSQSEDAIARAWRRQTKVEAKLDEGWRRPKGMHLATHERLLSIIEACDARRDAALIVAARAKGFAMNPTPPPGDSHARRRCAPLRELIEAARGPKGTPIESRLAQA